MNGPTPTSTALTEADVSPVTDSELVHSRDVVRRYSAERDVQVHTHAEGTPEESRAMGDRGRSLIMETYASPHVAASMKRLYRYLLGQEPKPEFVDLS